MDWETNPVDSLKEALYKDYKNPKKRIPHIKWNQACNGSFSNENGTLSISGYNPDNDTIYIKLQTAGEDICTGEIEGFAIIDGETATLEKWYEQEFCGVYFKFDGKKTITVEEEVNCLAYHGERCPFAGTYKK